MHPDSPRGRSLVRPTARKTYRVRFEASGTRVEVTLKASAPGNAAIMASRTLANPDVWSCTDIKQV